MYRQQMHDARCTDSPPNPIMCSSSASSPSLSSSCASSCASCASCASCELQSTKKSEHQSIRLNFIKRTKVLVKDGKKRGKRGEKDGEKMEQKRPHLSSSDDPESSISTTSTTSTFPSPPSSGRVRQLFGTPWWLRPKMSTMLSFW